MAPQLAPPGSSTYSSSTLDVGDGTWDASRRTFLLPNLVGFNFATTRYNGMGNRFAGLPQYHSLIRAHAIFAAIVFVIVIPTAIITARFYRRRPGWALRLHIWLQIITVALTTVVFVLGWFAVGPRRSLSNPHHDIGLTLYVLILFQAIAGAFVHRREKGKTRRRIPLKLMFHQWLGRGIALLGLAQVPLGLALYGSPAWLFVLYTLATFALLLIYFSLCYRDGKFVTGASSTAYGSTSEVVEDRHQRRRSGLGALGAAGAVGAGLAAFNPFRRRSRSRNRNRSRSRSRNRADVVGSRPPSYVSEKYSRDDERGGWKNRLLKIGAVVGAAALVKNLMGRRHDDERDSYRQAGSVDGSQAYTQDSPSRVSRLEEGHSPNRDYGGASHRRSDSYSSVASRTSVDSRGSVRRPKSRKGLGALAAFGGIGALLKGRRDRKERRRIEDLRRREIEEERRARRGNQGNHYTGDGYPRRGGRRGSLTSTEYTSPSRVNGRQGYHRHEAPPPVPIGGVAPPVAALGAAMPPPALVPGPPMVATNFNGNVANATAPLPIPRETGADPQGGQRESSGSETYISPGGRQHRRHHRSSGTDTATAAFASGGGAGPSSSGIVGGPPGATTSSRLQSGESQASPPISINVKYHGDEDRHVTLRRLPEQEAANAREMRRRERAQQGEGAAGAGVGAATAAAGSGNGGRTRRHRRRRRDSESELSGTEVAGPNERWRRVEDIERAQAEEQQRREAAAAAGQGYAAGPGPGYGAAPGLPPPPAGTVPVPAPAPAPVAMPSGSMPAAAPSTPGAPIPMPMPMPMPPPPPAPPTHQQESMAAAASTARNNGLIPPPPIPAASGRGNGNGNGYSYGAGSVAGGVGAGPGSGGGFGAGPGNGSAFGAGPGSAGAFGAGPGSAGGMPAAAAPGSVGSPGTATTEASASAAPGGGGGAGSDYATRRQRRRAERAAGASGASGSGSGAPRRPRGTVEFE